MTKFKLTPKVAARFQPPVQVNNENADEYEVHCWSAEASELGLFGWPLELATTLGNKMPFMRRSKVVDAENDIMWVTYVQANGCLTLRVYND